MTVTDPCLVLVGAELETRLLRACNSQCANTLCYRDWNDCFAMMAEFKPSVVVGELPADAAVDVLLLQSLQRPDAPTLILLASNDQMERALTLFQHGAFEYLPLSTSADVVLSTVAQALRRPRLLCQEIESDRNVTGTLVGESPAVRELQRSLYQLGKVAVPVLVRGEPGTGKQLYARLLHERSGVSGPFVVVKVGAVARTSVDVELFGLERMQQGENRVVRSGRIDEANNGTLFLDEVADLPLDAQFRLAEFLADRCYHRVGGYGTCHANVRVIAATRHALEMLVRNGQVLTDLYNRLAVVQVQVPRLQDRRQDIPALASDFLARAAVELALDSKQLAPDVMPILQQYDWPGNVRQLQNLCRRLAVMAPASVIQPEHLPLEMRPELLIANEARSWEAGLESWAEQALAAGHRNLLDVAQPVLERILLQAALKHTGGLKQEAALLLGWGRNTLTRKLRELAIEAGDDEVA